MNRILWTCALCALNCAPSVGATLSQNFVFGQVNESFVTPFNVSQFDPALGTLTGISFQLAGTQISSATVIDSSLSGSVSFISSSDFFISDADADVLDEVLPRLSITATVAPGGSHAFTIIAQETATATYSQRSAESALFPMSLYDGDGAPASPINSTRFTGLGDVGLTFHGVDFSTAGGSSTISGDSLIASGASNIGVTYTYNSTLTPTPTPEPGTLGMLALAGTVTLALYRRK